MTRIVKTRRVMLTALFVALIACVPARAADTCLSLPQARAAFPNVHLWWSRGTAGGRCWHNNAPAQRSTTRRPGPQTMPAPAPRLSVLWPVLAGAEPPIAAALYMPESMTGGPLLIDVDAITAPGVSDASGNDAADYCCWPPLEPAFADRWFAMPATWFVAAIGRDHANGN